MSISFKDLFTHAIVTSNSENTDFCKSINNREFDQFQEFNFLIGFCLVGSGKFVPKGTDFLVYETFLLSPYRGKAIFSYVMLQIFDRHKGKWMIFTHSTDNNSRAKAFWHKTVGLYTKGNYSTKNEIIDEMPKLVFKFEHRNNK